MRWRCPNQRRRHCRRRDDTVGCLVRSRMLWLLLSAAARTHAGGAFASACRTRLGGGDRREWWPMLQGHIAKRRQPGRNTC